MLWRLFIGSVTGLACLAAHAVQYRIREFPQVNGQEFFASAINDSGQCAGSVRVGSNIHAARYEANGTYTFVPFSSDQSMYGEEINEAGVIAGYNFVLSFRWSEGSGFEWLSRPNQNREYRAAGISGSNEVIGWELDANGYFMKSVSWSPTEEFTNLGSAFIEDINESGRMIGSDSLGAFYWDAGQSRHYLASGTGVSGISDNGSMSGIRLVPGSNSEVEAIIYRNGGASYEVLGRANAINEWALINDREEVTFSQFLPGSSVLQAKYWSAATGTRTFDSLLDANSQALQYSIMEGLDINNRGQAVATAKKPWQHSWEGKKVLLEPVPEPATFATLAIGVGALLRRRRRD